MSIITAPEAAERLGVTRHAIYQLIRRGRLKASKFGHVLMIDTKDLAKVKHRPRGRPRKKKASRVNSPTSSTVQPPFSTSPTALIGTNEAATRLGLTIGRIGQMIRAKQLPARKVGNTWLIDTRDLVKLKRRRPGRPRKKKTVRKKGK